MSPYAIGLLRKRAQGIQQVSAANLIPREAKYQTLLKAANPWGAVCAVQNLIFHTATILPVRNSHLRILLAVFFLDPESPGWGLEMRQWEEQSMASEACSFQIHETVWLGDRQYLRHGEEVVEYVETDVN